ncbi:transcriptional regulator, XRE family [Caldicellulosiruptor hydrothermalis 108]|uniref:Transcriptional regulator, XRE family n=1 Tax=Caldicellulosiruptor hydrothermalis (strain DSM 18901 / VKM B-2411 / 108) TaxID=632292 RepID=E4QDQ8_CALH1|nr:helix-turn-helix transcriptional regulator [Caldicellulosiruptor hydrothermalis]ADQ06475.1 transcriptional regulator, XRE family [Caldicellulosiruptor hydrothermalis 108]
MKDIIIQLKNIRKQKKITLQDLSLKTGISVKQLSKIENQKAIPSTATLQKIAAALDVKFLIVDDTTLHEGREAG